jgi:hypothetical protein
MKYFSNKREYLEVCKLMAELRQLKNKQGEFIHYIKKEINSEGDRVSIRFYDAKDMYKYTEKCDEDGRPLLIRKYLAIGSFEKMEKHYNDSKIME